MTKNDQNDPDQQFLRDVPMIWIKTDEATASSASIVATAMHVYLQARFLGTDHPG